MTEFTVETVIARPIEQVFQAFSDLEHFAERVKGITRVELLTPGPMRLGTRFRETRVFMGKEATETMEVSGFEPDRSYAVSAESQGTRFHSTFAFEPDGAGTKVRVHFSSTPLTLAAKLAAPLAALMMGTIRKCTEDDVADLKRFLEGAAGTT